MQIKQSTFSRRLGNNLATQGKNRKDNKMTNKTLKALAKRLRSHLPAERKVLKREAEIIRDEIGSLKWSFFKNSPSKIFTFIFDEKPINCYLPTFDNDYIQGTIFRSSNFFDIHTIKQADEFFKDKANILDIGANIGNNAIYYALIRNANKIYAFEPIKDTFEILCQNIELNALQDKIYPYNVALGLQEGKAVIKNRPADNCGGTEIETDNNGDLIIKSLDSFEFDEKIDFVKIDVEGFEAQVLLGAKAFLNKHKPIIAIEIHAHKFEESSKVLQSLDYEIIKQISEYDFICKTK